MLSLGNNDDYLNEIAKRLQNTHKDSDLFSEIVNAPFYDRRRTTNLGLGFLSFVLVNPKTKTIDRISISETDTAQGAIDITVKPFEDLKVPLNYRGNSVAEAIRSGRYQQTGDWNYLLTPVLKPEEARLNQAGAGISYSYVYPVKARHGGALIYQYFIPYNKFTREHTDFMFRYSKIVAKALNR